MFSSDACCFSNGQLKQLNDGEGLDSKTFYTGQNAWKKIHANQNKNKKKLQKIESPALPFLLYTIFHEKGTPFNTLLV